MLSSQKELFSLDADVHYLNNAYRAPLLKTAEAAAVNALVKQRNPFQFTQNDFFDVVDEVRNLFGKLVHCEPSAVVISPSTSYGLATVLNNIQGKPGSKAITLQDEFPSGYFSIERWAKENRAELSVIGRSDGESAETWNERLIQSIDEDTTVVMMSSIHWMSGIRFDLRRIGQRCRKVGAYFIVDGTQSVGAMPMDVEDYGIDALICAGYKWLLGPYSLAIGYVGPRFKDGVPLEESWINRKNARDFNRLSRYEAAYTPGAGRFNVGETSNFILMPMLKESLTHLLEWSPERTQQYAYSLQQPLREYITGLGGKFEGQEWVASHLFALALPHGMDAGVLKPVLDENKVYVSLRGDHLRVSINVYNDIHDINRLIEVMEHVR